MLWNLPGVAAAAPGAWHLHSTTMPATGCVCTGYKGQSDSSSSGCVPGDECGWQAVKPDRVWFRVLVYRLAQGGGACGGARRYATNVQCIYMPSCEVCDRICVQCSSCTRPHIPPPPAGGSHATAPAAPVHQTQKSVACRRGRAVCRGPCCTAGTRNAGTCRGCSWRRGCRSASPCRWRR